MEGTIKRIKLDNFVTYDSVECRPCENLNVIIGPNGTGKSTIVSAIMLGLGEKPVLTGRGKKVQEFIKTGKDEARILLELHPEHSVERRITADGKSAYKLNGKTVPERDINNFTKQLNIQVGNLCQFLPQDRVSEFARMDKKELLINTEKAVGGDELVNLHTELNNMQSTSTHHVRELDSMEKSLATKREQNARLDVDITTITEKNNLLLEIANLKKKLLWIQYNDAKNESDDAKRKFDPKNEVVKKAQAALEPVERKKLEFGRRLEEVKELRKRVRKTYDDFESMMKRRLEEVSDVFLKIKNLEKNAKTNAANDEKRANEIARFTQSIEDQSKIIQEMEASGGEKRRQMAAINEELNQYGRQIENLDEDISRLRHQANQFRYERDVLRRQISAVENVHAQKMDLLNRVNRDAFLGAQWVETNRDKFRGRVYLPLMVELNVTDARYINYVEAAIGYRDLVAFSCELTSDMNMLTNELRSRQGLRINVFTTDVARAVVPPHVSPQEIRRYGFDGYLDEFVDAPEPIMKCLKVSNSLHCIPVASKAISIEAGLPPSITRYYADGSVVSKRVSQYSNEPITSVSSVRNANCLRLSQNVTNVDAQRERLRQVEEEHDDLLRQADALNNEKARINDSSARKRQEKSLLGQHQTDLQNAKRGYERKKRDLEDMRRDREEYLREKDTLAKKIEDLIKDAVKKQVSCAAVYQKGHQVTVQLKKSKLEDFLARENLKKVERKHKALKEALDAAENDVAVARAEHHRLKTIARNLLEEAKAGTDGMTAQDEGFKWKYKELFETFPRTVEGLEGLINEKSALVACKKDVDNSILHDYQKRAREIEQLEKDIKKKEADIVSYKARMSRIKDDWLTRLHLLVNKISENFRKYYKEINCAGDVVLEPGSEEHDYKNYGLSVKVSYRESAPLKELDQFTQSGGERAVATALFMISLQELTKVPFRCVDEINQGMDEMNERRVYKLLMSITSSKNTSQYFLLTPKLLKDIDYSDTCMVHCVFNGPYVLPWKYWNIDSFISKKKRRLMDTD